MPVDAAAAKSIFLAALDREDQSAFIDAACSDNPDLRARVQALLEAHSAGSFPDYVAAVEDTRTAAHTPDDPTRTGGTAATDPPDLSFLDPPREPGNLGRLDHYEVRSVVGRGGMGVVFKAHDESLDRIVAIKVLAPQYAANAAARKRFIREAKAVAAVVHEHVVAVHQVDDRVPYLVMQLIGGVSLQERLDRTGPLPVPEVLRIGMQIASGLAAAHKQGIVHRDIKPSNILLENGVERVKITDFGLARAVDDASVTQSGVIAGTPLYMSPEQARGETVGPRSDLFSLGSVLYAMSTGHAPFRASGTMAVLRRVIEDPPRPPRSVNPDVPAWMEAIVLKLLSKDPADRFPSAAAVAELLAGHLAHLQQPDRVPRPAPVRIDRSPPPAKPRPRSVPWWVWLIVVLAAAPCLLAVAIGVLYFLWASPSDEVRQDGPPPPVPHGPMVGPAGEKQVMQAIPADAKPIDLAPPKLLDHMVGTWATEITTRTDPTRPGTSRHVGRTFIEPVAGGRYIRMRVITDGGGPDELQIQWFDLNAQEFRGAYFDSGGEVRGPSVGRFDAETRTLTTTSQPTNGVVRVMNRRFPDSDTMTWDVVWRDRAGKVLLDRRGEMVRQKVGAPIPPADDTGADRPNEMTALDHLVGTWDVAWGERVNPDERQTAQEVGARVLGGRFVEVRERVAATGEEHYFLYTFDPAKKAYRRWHFSPRGWTAESVGRWDEKAKTLAWTVETGPHQGSRLTWTFASADRTDFRFEIQDKDGKPLSDQEGSHVRRKPD